LGVLESGVSTGWIEEDSCELGEVRVADTCEMGPSIELNAAKEGHWLLDSWDSVWIWIT